MNDSQYETARDHTGESEPLNFSFVIRLRNRTCTAFSSSAQTRQAQ